MKQLARRVRLLEERVGYTDKNVYFIEAKDLTEAEIDKEAQRVNEINPNAVIFIDDVPLGDEADGY